MKKPIIGQIVHFILPNGPNQGSHRPALITSKSSEGNSASLIVFSIPNKDGAQFRDSTTYLEEVEYSPAAASTLNTWHYPEKE